MKLSEIKQLDKTCFLNVFGDRLPAALERGRGMKVWDSEGKMYTDFLAGIAVTSLGHSDPALVKAVSKQARKLIHCSNYYYIENQALLARLLVENSCADKVFFGNSGAEANECAFKFARLYFRKRGMPDKYEIISLNNSFHGRTLATVAATGQTKYREPFEPLMPGFKFADANDFAAIEAMITPQTAAILIEPLQGEGGIHAMEPDYLAKLRKLCDDKDMLLIFDEIQSGLGRTGKLFAYEHSGIEPDIFTIAKSLGGGIPISACLMKQKVADCAAPGDHGSTFGGNPLACAAGLCVLTELLKRGLPAKAAAMGKYFTEKLEGLKANHSVIKGVRGMGLMLGLVLTEPIAADIKARCLEAGFLVGTAGGDVVRFLPPLIVSERDIDSLVAALDKILP